MARSRDQLGAPLSLKRLVAGRNRLETPGAIAFARLFSVSFVFSYL